VLHRRYTRRRRRHPDTDPDFGPRNVQPRNVQPRNVEPRNVQPGIFKSGAADRLGIRR
jgi:hypothetical protein